MQEGHTAGVAGHPGGKAGSLAPPEAMAMTDDLDTTGSIAMDSKTAQTLFTEIIHLRLRIPWLVTIRWPITIPWNQGLISTQRKLTLGRLVWKMETRARRRRPLALTGPQVTASNTQMRSDNSGHGIKGTRMGRPDSVGTKDPLEDLATGQALNTCMGPSQSRAIQHARNGDHAHQALISKGIPGVMPSLPSRMADR